MHFIKCRFYLKGEKILKNWSLANDIQVEIFRNEVYWCLQLIMTCIQDIETGWLMDRNGWLSGDVNAVKSKIAESKAGVHRKTEDQ